MSANAPLPQPAPLPRPAPSPPPCPAWTWDIFCQVIDNLGDVGVCWRLAADLAKRGHFVRLWLDDTSALPWMAPGAIQGAWPNVVVYAWRDASAPAVLATLAPAQVWVESFGCELPYFFVAERTRLHAACGLAAPTWINLEYLSAERFVERCHRLPSPVMSGPAASWTKHFFYPGFTQRTGGLLREPDLLRQRAAFDPTARSKWLCGLGLGIGLGIADQSEILVSLFCYASAPVDHLLAKLLASPRPVHLLVTAGQAREAVEQALSRAYPRALGPLRISYLPLLTQTSFDELLWACDINFVRGEDSLVRALWAGRPFVWQIYPQDDGAHEAKLFAFLETLGAPPEVRAWHAQWNGLAKWDASLPLVMVGPSITQRPRQADPSEPWTAWAQAMAPHLSQQTDLVGQLCDFVQTCQEADQAKKTR